MNLSQERGASVVLEAVKRVRFRLRLTDTDPDALLECKDLAASTKCLGCDWTRPMCKELRPDSVRGGREGPAAPARASATRSHEARGARGLAW